MKVPPYCSTNGQTSKTWVTITFKMMNFDLPTMCARFVAKATSRATIKSSNSMCYYGLFSVLATSQYYPGTS